VLNNNTQQLFNNNLKKLGGVHICKGHYTPINRFNVIILLIYYSSTILYALFYILFVVVFFILLIHIDEKWKHIQWQ